jgi:hypothetical protein
MMLTTLFFMLKTNNYKQTFFVKSLLYLLTAAL